MDSGPRLNLSYPGFAWACTVREALPRVLQDRQAEPAGSTYPGRAWHENVLEGGPRLSQFSKGEGFLMRTFSIVLFSFLVLIGVGSVGAAPKQEPLVEQVRKSIEKSKEYLLRHQTADGNWELEDTAANFRGGPTSLALLALMNAGVPPEDPAIQKGLKWLRNIPPEKTYVVGLQTMVFCLAGMNEDRPLIQNRVRWLDNAKTMRGTSLLGWTYTPRAMMADNSNSQYAILGLHEAQTAGLYVNPQTWKEIGMLYMSTQVRGGWGYHSNDQPTFTMTTAGLCGLLMASMDLNQNREISSREGHWNNCGVYKEAPFVAQAQNLLGDTFPNLERIPNQPHLFYFLYGLERAGRLTGLRFMGGHDWYWVGCQYLTRAQAADGSCAAAILANRDRLSPPVSACSSCPKDVPRS